MKCDECDKPAVVHEVTIRNGVKREMHLCAEHAAEAGLVVHDSVPIDQMLQQFMVSHAGGSKKKQKACPRCGLTWGRFRKTTTLGCPTCYEAFLDELVPLIERAHGGSSHHIGKTPASSGAALDRKREIRRLTQELEDAVAAEEYERAAQLRDRLNTLEPLPEEEEP